VIRLTWLQFRAQAAAAFGVLAVVATGLAVTGPHLLHLYHASGIATCHARDDCGLRASVFLRKLALGQVDQVLYFLGIGILFAAPAIIGMFWGAPLVARELQAHTSRLAWTQGVTRTRWLAVKLCVTGMAAMATAGLLSLMLTWWSSPIDRAVGLKYGNSVSFIRLGVVLFPTRGITPVGYAGFAFALGVTAGVLTRRTLPAMAVTLAGFAAAQIAMPLWIRPHLIAPARALVALNRTNISSLARGSNGRIIVNPPASAPGPGAWLLSTKTIDEAGRIFNVATVRACLGSHFPACQASLGRLHLRDLVTYQPASRFWALQWHETVIFLGLAVLLAAVCFWRVRRSSSLVGRAYQDLPAVVSRSRPASPTS
jgi:hypothetical protein